ncbi:hypothetical protein ACSR0Z_33220 [Streptomyces viridosporus]
MSVGLGRGGVVLCKNPNATSATFTDVAFRGTGEPSRPIPDKRFYAGLADSFVSWTR